MTSRHSARGAARAATAATPGFWTRGFRNTASPARPIRPERNSSPARRHSVSYELPEAPCAAGSGAAAGSARPLHPSLPQLQDHFFDLRPARVGEAPLATDEDKAALLKHPDRGHVVRGG